MSPSASLPRPRSSRLIAGEATVTELAAAPLDMSQSAVSKHLKALERAGLVSRRSEAQRRPVRLRPHPLEEATVWLEGFQHYREESFRRLDGALEELAEPQETEESTDDGEAST